jgi:hypothetical protein
MWAYDGVLSLSPSMIEGHEPGQTDKQCPEKEKQAAKCRHDMSTRDVSLKCERKLEPCRYGEITTMKLLKHMYTSAVQHIQQPA